MREVIVLDDDDDHVSPAFAEQRQPVQSLSQEQRARMAQQKELALVRRLAKCNSSKGGATEPRILETSDFPTAVVHHQKFEYRGAESVGRGGHVVPSPYFGGVASGGVKRAPEGVVDLPGGEGGWRSVRKRPVPGQSFGREMAERGDDGGHGEAPGTDSKDERGKENEQAGSRSSSVPAEGAKVDPPEPKPRPKPSEQQMQVLNAIRHGKSVFLTGSAGTGKSFVIDYAVRILRIVHGGDVYVTASTGLAACALGGTTLHSFAGVGLGTGKKEALLEKAKGRRDVRNRWMFAKALIIDEISMIDGEFFDKLDYVGRMLRRNPRPFGGIQLIVTGDFYQLPPVSPENPAKYFAFEADCWENCFHHQVELEIVFRQSDEEFVRMLNEIRRGQCSPSLQTRLQSCSGPVGDDSGVILTRLYPRKMDVGRENNQNLRALGQPTVVFNAKDESRNEFARRQLDNVRVEAVISLSLGAQVMLAKNLEASAGLVNGARGVVVGFTSPGDPRSVEIQKTARSVNPSGLWPLVKFACDNVERVIAPEVWSILEGEVEVAQRTQIPLLLAWALSVHKCQGMTLDRVETDLSRAFDYGMVYVALSRVKSLDGLRLIGFDPSKIRVHPKVSKYYDKLQQAKVAVETASTS